MAEQTLDIEIRPTQPGDRLTGLSLGDPDHVPLKTYLRRHALAHHTANLAKTYGVFLTDDPTKLIAYVTLVCGEIETEEQVGEKIGDDLQYRYAHCPAVKIARLAVDRRHGGLGIG